MFAVNKSSATVETDTPGGRPAVAAGLSLLVPGLGQVYNQSSKGLLFLCVGLMNLVLVGLVLFSEQLVRTLYDLARRADMQLDAPVFSTLHWIHSTPPVVVIVLLFAAGFAAFCMRDAYNDARLRRRATSVAGSDNLSKAAGASYVGHILLLLVCLVAGSLSVPKEKPEEKSVCEFVLQNENEKHKEKTENISLSSAAAHGRFDERKELNNTRANAPSDDVAPLPDLERTVKAQQASLLQQPLPPRQAALPERPLEQQQEKKATPKNIARTDHQGQMKQVALVRNALQPQVKLIRQPDKPERKTEPKPRKAEKQQKQQKAVRAREATKPRQTAKPVQPRTATPPETAPDFRRRNASRRAPEQSGRSFNQRRDVDDKDGSVAANADVNFGPYMQQLQRRLKRNWNPPASSVARAVTVHFKIQSDGRITNLRLARSSGIGGCDSAALQAVEAASPVMPLPSGSAGSVPIEFTFEYTRH
ncbi:MAG: TonB family protein [Candidatus Obscuribacterales bacterium]|nr:TonB family protein [Candidatus Obscuribacterales bacterium]